MSDLGKKLLSSLDECLDWAQGKGTMRVTFPGEEAREMTVEEYHERKALREATSQRKEPLLRVHSVDHHVSRSGWPVWYCFTKDGDKDVIVSTEAGILRVVRAGEQLYTSGPKFSKENKPVWDDVCEIANIEEITL